MSVNDPDDEPWWVLSREEFIEILVGTGWKREVAEKEWERFRRERLPESVRICDLEW